MEYTSDNSNIPDDPHNDLNKNSSTSDSTDSNSDDTGGVDGSNSSSPSDYEEEGFFVQNYAINPEWKDISAIKPDPYEAKVLGIPYTIKFREAHEYFRAILKKNELSERALKLTEDCISWNPANSTVWVFRRKCLSALGKNLIDELDYLNDIIVDHSKNYQVWQHRRWIIELLADPKTEKDFTDKLFKQDGKNYHAWQYRQWVISHFEWWEGELEYTEELITEDLRNNSAWNHRYFVLKRTKQLQNNEIIENEVAFSVEKILKVPENESPWNYLRGILAGVGLNKFPEKTKVFENITSVHCFSFRIDAMEELLRGQNTKDQMVVHKILELVEKLSTEMDVIRSQYWLFIGRNISEKYGTKKDSMID